MSALSENTKSAIYEALRAGHIERVTSPEGTKAPYIWPYALSRIQASEPKLDLRLNVVSDRQTVDQYILKNWDTLLAKAIKENEALRK